MQIRINGGSWVTRSAIFSSSSGTYVPYQMSLSEYVDSTIEVAFLITTENRTDYTGGYCDQDVAPGWYIDSVAILTSCPTIFCPLDTIAVHYDGTGQVCLHVQVWNADSVSVEGASWANNELCFVPDSLGSHKFQIVATNSICADTCSFTVNVSGVKVGDETVPPGGTVRVPITLQTDQPLSGFTIP